MEGTLRFPERTDNPPNTLVAREDEPSVAFCRWTEKTEPGHELELGVVPDV